MNWIVKTLGLITLSVLAGCQGLRSPGQFSSDEVIRYSGTDIDLIAELSKDKQTKPAREMTDSEYALALEKALQNFATEWGPAAKDQRNGILNRIVMASNQTCERFKADLMHRQARMNFFLGSAGSALGAAGAVVRGVSAANNLSAAAAITSGVRAEYNQEYFADQAAGILARAIDKQREEMVTAFLEAQKRDIPEYSVHLAIADGVLYQGSCSLAGAYKYADHAISSVDVTKGLKSTAASALVQPRPAASAAR